MYSPMTVSSSEPDLHTHLPLHIHISRLCSAVLTISHNGQLFLGETVEKRMIMELMLKTRPPCTGAEANLRDRVWGDIEKKSFIALPSKGGHSQLLPSKLCVSTLGGFGESFIAMVQKWGLLIMIRVCAGLHFFQLGLNRSPNEFLCFSGVIKL